ncbi:MAG: PKD domain-containing protein [Euryarchaeota archaeon]|nr:PKD domain-containing protein [Euryarchaeota archaeon]MDE1837783.1 PKD domain-containing protein [Euryarchaeota archaeon]MDE1881290.1 PKD domain-containing protein [Euryarchaeota archaeon]MDE2046167.1 PKD domain-containing protein [Thermoplasmata archaeon]
MLPRKGLTWLLTAALLLSSLILGAPSVRAAPPVPQPLRVAVPLYIYPGAAWSTVQNDSAAVGFVVVNPSSGPGSTSDPTYVQAVKATQGQGIRVLGYVHTSYAGGGVSVSQAESWVDDYYNWYGVDGIFFDEASNVCTASTVAYYSTLYNYTKAKAGLDDVVLNPGTATGACYGPISDVLLTFEDTYANYTTAYTGASWTMSYAPSHFWHVVYGVGSVAQMESVLTLAHARGAGWVFATDLGLPNPYGALPSYWGSEVGVADPLQVSNVSVAPAGTLTVGSSATFSVIASGGGWNYTYLWSGLPPGCASQNASSLTCAPSAPGNYSVNVTVTDADGALVPSAATLVKVVGSTTLSAQAAGPPSAPCGTAVGFNGTANGGVPPYLWSWTFGDGSASTSENPLHAYSNGGTYSVTLTVRDHAGGSATSGRSINITSGTSCVPPLTVAAMGTPTTGSAPLSAAFSSTPVGGVPLYRFAWRFGDGGPAATTQNATHLFVRPGTFLTRVWVNDTNGDSVNASVVVRVESVSALTVVASMKVLNVSCACGTCKGHPGLNASLTSSVGGGVPPYSFDWSFGDGSSDWNSENATHAYAGQDPWTATVTVTDSRGSRAVANVTVTESGLAFNCPSVPPPSPPYATWALLIVVGGAVLVVAMLVPLFLFRRRRRPSLSEGSAAEGGPQVQPGREP